MSRRKKGRLSESDWARVFTLRCRTKRGERLSDEEMKLIDRAWREDDKRYAALNEAVFEATHPMPRKS